MVVNLPHDIAYEDLYSAGALGLVDAARRFDTSRGIQFSTYATRRIRGSMLDDLRARAFASLRILNRIRKVRNAFETVASKSGRTPDDVDVAREAGLSMEQYYRTLEDAKRQTFLSVHGLLDEQPSFENLIPTSRERDPAASAETSERREILSKSIRQLPAQERMVIMLYYMKDLNMREIGATLGVNESRVCQLHSSALFKLSMKLKKNGIMPPEPFHVHRVAAEPHGKDDAKAKKSPRKSAADKKRPAPKTMTK